MQTAVTRIVQGTTRKMSVKSILHNPHQRVLSSFHFLLFHKIRWFVPVTALNVFLLDFSLEQLRKDVKSVYISYIYALPTQYLHMTPPDPLQFLLSLYLLVIPQRPQFLPPAVLYSYFLIVWRQQQSTAIPSCTLRNGILKKKKTGCRASLQRDFKTKAEIVYVKYISKQKKIMF